MTPPPSPPNRRRRRIVVTIAVLVLGLGWWFWPRADQRVIGIWLVETHELPGSRVFSFAQNHRGQESLYSAERFPVSHTGFHWWLDGDELLIQNSSSRSTNGLDYVLKKLTSVVTGATCAGTLGVFKIRESSADQIIIDHYDSNKPAAKPKVMRLRRVTGWPPNPYRT